MKIVGIEYSGIGSQPLFIVQRDNGEVEFIPVERGVTKLDKEKVA